MAVKQVQNKLALVANRDDVVDLGRPRQTAAQRESVYKKAMRRLIARLTLRATPGDPDFVRAKRRIAKPPIEASRTIESYSRTLELFSLWTQEIFGRELEPIEVTHEVVSNFAGWLASDEDPDIRPIKIELSLSPDHAEMWRTLERVSVVDWVTIPELYQAFSPALRDKFTLLDGSPNFDGLVKTLNEIPYQLGFRRTPTSKQVHQKYGITARLDAKLLKVRIVPKTPLQAGSIYSYLSCLAAVWNELMRGDNLDESPIKYNIFKDVIRDWSAKAKRTKAANAKARLPLAYLITALETACDDGKLGGVRDLLAVRLMAYLGLRIEEAAGLLRKDIAPNNQGQYVLTVAGKGDKPRAVIMSGKARDALVELDAMIRTKAASPQTAAWADAMLDEDAPLLAPLPRWGRPSIFENHWDAGDPKQPLSVRALGYVIERRANLAEVIDSSGERRKLTDGERLRVHPHGLRHYAATLMRQGGASLDVVGAVLGHASVVTTERYVHTEDAPARDPSLFVEAAQHGTTAQEVMVPTKQRAAEPQAVRPSEFDERERRLVEKREKKKKLKKPYEKPAPKIITDFEQAPAQPAAVATPKARFTPKAEGESTPPVERAKVPSRKPLGEQAPAVSVELEQQIPRRLGGIRAPVWAYSPEVPEQTEGFQPAPGDKLPDEDLRAMQSRFVRGTRSRLPYWTGEIGSWSGKELMPVLSPYQVSHSIDLSRGAVDALKGVYARALADKGPTAAGAVLAWIEYAIEPVAHALDAIAVRREAAWIPWTEEALPTENVVREHLPSQIASWFATYAPIMPRYESGKPRLANDAEKLPDWFFADDPILELSEAEREECRQYIDKLQGIQPKSERGDNALDLFLTLFTEYATATRSKLSVDRPEIARSDEDHRKMAREVYPAQLKKMGKELFKIDFDVEEVLKRSESGAKARLQAYLRAKGAGQINIPGAVKAACLETDKLTWQGGTIVHSDAVKRAFLDRYHTDSECVTRRAVRWLWERRKAGKKDRTETIVAQYEMLMAFLVPCPARLEEAMIAAGINPQAFAETRKRTVLWADMVEKYSRLEGGRYKRILENNEVTVNRIMQECQSELDAVQERLDVRTFRQNPPLPVPDPVEAIFAAHMPV